MVHAGVAFGVFVAILRLLLLFVSPCSRTPLFPLLSKIDRNQPRSLPYSSLRILSCTWPPTFSSTARPSYPLQHLDFCKHRVRILGRTEHDCRRGW
ncbi:hypothetical protein BC938DRAFT_479949 [Jimgerdemannia flammicorona]|uniref:Secreted protein n=1 Tax=Jimgerdemannia flammicorona TaxID=994334 RepID=A0A433QJQ6_9FUNG|nr:hypothetical protein BC938DRAFT_479949 [Jimgerdemannia flammicorona]